jgi:hypothetical protein
MPAAALLDVARESPMPTLTERLAYFLAFFASYQNIDCLSLPFLLFSRHL